MVDYIGTGSIRSDVLLNIYVGDNLFTRDDEKIRVCVDDNIVTSIGKSVSDDSTIFSYAISYNYDPTMEMETRKTGLFKKVTEQVEVTHKKVRVDLLAVNAFGNVRRLGTDQVMIYSGDRSVNCRFK